MVTAKFDEGCVTTVYGLTQWDYGQELAVEADFDIVDGTEVQFYQGSLATTRYLRGRKVVIPDAMLQDDQTITVYVYVRMEDSGETVLTAYMRITARGKPTDYVIPDTQDYRRLLPEGGEPGQVPIRLPGADFAVGWGYQTDGAAVEDGYLQLMSGDVKVGNRVRLPTGTGREIEMVNDGTNIKWRYTDSNEWVILISLASLQGSPGITPRFEIRDGNMYAIWPE